MRHTIEEPRLSLGKSGAVDPAGFVPPLADVETSLRRWLDGGRRIALALVIETWGSAPVPVGGMMAIAADDAFAGSVSGGCIEADVIAAARDVMESGEPQTLAFGIEDETAWRAGLACGGTIRILVFPLSPDLGRPLFDRIRTARESRRPIVVRWPLEGGAVTTFDDAAVCDENLSASIRLGQSRSIGEGGEAYFLQAFLPPPRVIIFGATHIAQHLARLCSEIGYAVHVSDPRSAFTGADRFEPAAVGAPAWPSETDLTLDAYSAVVALTHVSAIDDEALHRALVSDCRYVGALGSRKTHAARVERLRKAGFSDDQISRVAAPIGLDIGAKSAGEIAVSILAQIIEAFRKPVRP